jgi:TFIIF-interacting CTD phosphatase-like protein
LRLLGRDLRRTVLVDDSVAALAAQPANGIPCPPFRGDLSDTVRAAAAG